MIEELSEIVPHHVDYYGNHTAYGRIRIYGQYYWMCIDADGIPYILNEDGSVCQSSSRDEP